MTGSEFRAIRQRLGLSQIAMARALGYEGADDSVSVSIRRYENGGRPIPPAIGRLAYMLGRHGVPEMWNQKGDRR